MKPKQYLMQIEILTNKIEHRKKELEEIKILSTSIGSFDYSRDLVNTTKTGDTLEKKVIRIADLEEQIARMSESLLCNKHQIISEIEAIASTDNESSIDYSELLYKRYVELKCLEQIAIEMSYTYDRIKHMHGEALEYFGRMMLAPSSTE